MEKKQSTSKIYSKSNIIYAIYVIYAIQRQDYLFFVLELRRNIWK